MFTKVCISTVIIDATIENLCLYLHLTFGTVQFLCVQCVIMSYYPPSIESNQHAATSYYFSVNIQPICLVAHHLREFENHQTQHGSGGGLRTHSGFGKAFVSSSLLSTALCSNKASTVPYSRCDTINMTALQAHCCTHNSVLGVMHMRSVPKGAYRDIQSTRMSMTQKSANSRVSFRDPSKHKDGQRKHIE